MLRFGDKLKHERESRNTTLEDLSGTTGIGLSYLEALEHNQFEDLPGRAFGKMYIRAYAEVLGFDPKPLIQVYDRDWTDRVRQLPPEAWNARPILVPPLPKREAEPAAPEEAEVDPATREEPVEVAPLTTGVVLDPSTRAVAAPDALRPLRPAAALVVIVAVVALGTYLVFFRGDGPEANPPSVAAGTQTEIREPVSTPTSPPESPTAGPGEIVAAPGAKVPDEQTPRSPETRATPRGALGVTEFGIARDRRLREPDDTFEEGEVVWFSTRVIGGGPGDTIRHVWLRDGKPVQSTELRVGSSHWRTQSYKTLWGTGAWSVEARDREGRTLAAATFTCVAQSR